MKSYIESGELAPDSIVIGMIRNYINEHKDATGNIFDGFPRTTAQAEEFDRILAEEGDAVNVMVYMDVPEEELVKRILLRGKESDVPTTPRRISSATVSPFIATRQPS